MSEYEKNCQWHFAEQLGGADIGPNEAMSENFKKNRYASLIRESIQNSLDAVDDVNEPVTVSFQFKKMDTNRFPNFFELREDIIGCINFYSGNRNAKEKYQPMLEYVSQFVKQETTMPYLAISDYNTKGMDYQADDTNCPFYAFVQSIGVTSKNSDSAGGSFGFGKAAYFGLSQISTMLVSTRTKDGKCFFEGVASLCTHTKGDKKRTAIGFYDNNGGRPIKCEENIPNRFLRKKEEGSGTNFYIMGTDTTNIDNIIEEMTDAVLRNFWLSIYRNKLKVLIGSEERKEEINLDNIANRIEKRFTGLIDTNSRATYNPRPYFDAVRFSNRNREYCLFEKELRLLGRVHFYTFKYKDANDRISYMRAPLMLIFAKKYQTNYGFYGVFICDDNRGNEILRKMENPSHNEWDHGNWPDKKKNSIAKEALKELDTFIRECIAELFKASNSSILKITDLENYLYIPTALEEDEDFLPDEILPEKIENEERAVSLQSDLTSEKVTLPKYSLSMGKVLIEKKTKATISTNGGLYSGHSNKTVKSKGGGAGSRKLDTKNTPDEHGKMGNYAEPVWVKYRTFAQRKNNCIQHHIIIYSGHEIENGKVSLVIAGEQTDDKVNIIHTNKGRAYQNVISKLYLSQGKNEIIVQLSDNMKHALKLEVYESH